MHSFFIHINSQFFSLVTLQSDFHTNCSKNFPYFLHKIFSFKKLKQVLVTNNFKLQ